MSLRWKILTGFLLLSLLLAVAGIWSIYHFNFLGGSVQKVMDENYRSVDASITMLEALEREDSAILLYLLKNKDVGHRQLTTADSLFRYGLNQARANITMPEENDLISAIDQTYLQFRKLFSTLLENTGEDTDLDWYFNEAHRTFQDTKLAVRTLMQANDSEMYRQGVQMKDEANRASMPGVVAIIVALFFSLIFSYFVHYFMIRPMLKMINGIETYLKTGSLPKLNVNTQDELGKLAISIQILCSKTDLHRDDQ